MFSLLGKTIHQMNAVFVAHRKQAGPGVGMRVYQSA